MTLKVKKLILKNKLLVAIASLVVSILGGCSSESQYVFWEDLDKDTQNRTINKKQVNKYAKSIYWGIERITDNDDSFLLLNELTSFEYNKHITAFYYYIFGTICKASDGAMAECLGNYCLKALIIAPEYNLIYFKRDYLLLKRYAELIGYELAQNQNSLTNYCTLKNRIKEISNRNEEIRDLCETLLNQIDENYANME